MNITQYAVIGLLVTIMGMGIKIQMDKNQRDELIASHVMELAEMTRKYELSNAKNTVYESNEAVYKSTIDSLNNEISKHQVSIDEAKTKLAEWEAKPKEVKYKKLYEQLKSIKENTNDCERYEDTNSALDGFDLNQL